MGSLINPFKVIVSNKNLIFDLTRRELESRYKGSKLGRLWIAFHHLSMISIYTFVFAFVFKTKVNTDMGEIGVDFALWLYCGLLPWFFLNESLTISVKDIVSKVSYVKKIVFPLEILPIVTVIVAFLNMCIGLLLLVIGLLIFGHGLHLNMLWFLLIIPPILLSVSGLSLITSSLGVFFRDLAQLIGLLTMLWMYATPILYSLDMVPSEFKAVLLANPLTNLVEWIRNILFWNNSPNFSFVAIFYFSSVLLYWIGFQIFEKVKKGFADVL